MPSIKHSVSFRLSVTTINELEELAARNHVSQSEVIALSIHHLHEMGNSLDKKLEDWFKIVRLS